VASDGTHRFGLLFDFWRQPPLPEVLPLPRPPDYRSEVMPKSASPKGQFFVYSNADSVTVVTLQVRRMVDDDISQHDLSSLLPADPGGARGEDADPLMHLVPELEVGDQTVMPRELYSTAYRGALEGIALDMIRSDVSTEVVTYPGAELRGNALVNQITGNRRSVSKHIPIYAVDSLQLRPAGMEGLFSGNDAQRLVRPESSEWAIVPIFKSGYRGQWRFEVRTAFDSTIFSDSGTDEPPDTIHWNWKAASGDPIPPGTYYVVFESRGLSGKPEFSTRHFFNAYYLHRTLDIAVTRESRIGKVNADRYVLILSGKSGNNDAATPEDPVTGGAIESQPREPDAHE